MASCDVNEGEDATSPNPNLHNGYEFVGWDKDFTNVSSDLDVYALYEIITYNVSYDLNGGSWWYSNKREYVEAFLKDFYDFLGLNTELDDFMYFVDGTLKGDWKDYIGGSVGATNKLLYDNDIDANNDDYFFNSSLYKEKWYDLSSYVKNKVCANNQRFGGKNGYLYGALDFYRYIIGNPESYIDIYGGQDVFYGFPTKEYAPSILNYDVNSEDFDLFIPISDNFEGWYTTDGLKIDTVNTINATDINVIAKWNDIESYNIYFDVDGGEAIDALTLERGTNFDLPIPKYTGMKFLGWYYKGVALPNQITFEYHKDITIKAVWLNPNEISLENLVYDGTTITYRNSSIAVEIPTSYIQGSSEFRGVWISSMVGNFTPSTNKEKMMSELTSILDFLEELNMNAVVFHLRTHNNAYYKTKLAPIHSAYGNYSTFETWDYLTWFIEECHKRNIEFHAWLNPYRVLSSGGSDLNAIASTFAGYNGNPAANPDNLLMNSSGGVILNPAIPDVRNYIISVCMEIIANYDVDAIHFDDYFYIDGVDDSAARKTYNTSGLSVDDFRREQVNMFIQQLHARMKSYNTKNNRHVQLGISPTGIYRNGNGTVESGSNTSGYAHYGSPLYADTLKWAREGWIEYLLPQSYWGFSHRTAGYADVMDWWNLAFEGLNCNLYSGIGIYMNNTSGNNYSWGTQPYEVSNQVLYTTKLNNVKGVCFYSYTYLKSAYNNSSTMAYKGIHRVKDEYWTTKIATPETQADNIVS